MGIAIIGPLIPESVIMVSLIFLTKPQAPFPSFFFQHQFYEKMLIFNSRVPG
ncbi:hypothetical protein KSS87_013626 [Heliosperma pusillum]|nr:hypothetical protein KSS87_013626 [Heliosperma pusillum]